MSSHDAQGRPDSVAVPRAELERLLKDYRQLVVGTAQREPVSPAYAALRATLGEERP